MFQPMLVGGLTPARLEVPDLGLLRHSQVTLIKDTAIRSFATAC